MPASHKENGSRNHHGQAARDQRPFGHHRTDSNHGRSGSDLSESLYTANGFHPRQVCLTPMQAIIMLSYSLVAYHARDDMMHATSRRACQRDMCTACCVTDSSCDFTAGMYVSTQE
jgi:hypothetical protein